MESVPLVEKNANSLFQREIQIYQEIIRWASPRVDSRQIIVDSVILIICNVGGSGEAGYYSEIIPVARKINISFPIFFRYIWIFYNTPWNKHDRPPCSLSYQETRVLECLEKSNGRKVWRGKTEHSHGSIENISRYLDEKMALRTS